MSRQQQILSFATKRGKFYKVAGRGLIRDNDLSQKFKRMTLGSGAPAREKLDEEMGGSVRHHNRPYQLKDMNASRATSTQPKSASAYKPIQFKL